jgi:hypothetical protein
MEVALIVMLMYISISIVERILAMYASLEAMALHF